MAYYVIDRVGFFEPGEYEFRELLGGTTEAKAWLTRNAGWKWYLNDDAMALIETLLGDAPLVAKHERVPLPKLGPDDEALFMYRDPALGRSSERLPTNPPGRIKDWEFGVLRKARPR
jgi:hypothetical protein